MSIQSVTNQSASLWGSPGRPTDQRVGFDRRRQVGPLTGNEISGLSVSLPVHIADPAERARLVAVATRIAKEDHEILGPQLYGRMMTYLPTAIAPAAFRWLARREAPNKMMNVAVSSVAGPRDRGRFGGASVSEIYSTGSSRQAPRSTSPCGAMSTS